MILFIDSILAHDYPQLTARLSLVLVMWLVVLAAVVINLIAGVNKARSAGIARTSYGFRRTVSKLVQYYSVMLFALMFDIIASLLVKIPYFTMLASAFLVFIEARSVYEKAEDKIKKKAAENISHLLILLDNRDDLLKALSEILKNKESNE